MVIGRLLDLKFLDVDGTEDKKLWVRQKIMENVENLEKLAVKAGFKNYKEFKNKLDKDKMLAFGVKHYRPDAYEFVSWLMSHNRVAVRFSSLKNDGYFLFKVEDRLVGVGIDYFLNVGMVDGIVRYVWFMKNDFGDIGNRKSITISIKFLKKFEEYEVDNIEKIRKVCWKYGIEYLKDNDLVAENGVTEMRDQ